ncbi:single-stranded DNA-binding protein [bacterium]|nr:single-stranded DNA-binding protein [bacterium]
MASFNKVILMGNLVFDPEVRYTAGGTAVTELRLAVNRYWFDKQANERREETTFVDVTLWDRKAEVAGEYLAKGRPVLIEGRLQLDTWDDKETGQKRSKLRVVGETMQLLGGRGDSGSSGPRSAPGGQSNDGQSYGGANDSSSGGGPSGDFEPSSGGGIPDDDVPF